MRQRRPGVGKRTIDTVCAIEQISAFSCRPQACYSTDCKFADSPCDASHSQYLRLLPRSMLFNPFAHTYLFTPKILPSKRSSPTANWSSHGRQQAIRCALQTSANTFRSIYGLSSMDSFVDPSPWWRRQPCDVEFGQDMSELACHCS